MKICHINYSFSAIRQKTKISNAFAENTSGDVKNS